MKCELTIGSGARAGHREVYDKPYIGIGRHPMSDLRFDAEQDLDASARHAAIVRTGTTFVLRDLGSTNGTFVNGERIAAERQIHDGDTIRFGMHGPEVSFHVLRDAGEEVVMPAVHAPPRGEEEVVMPAVHAPPRVEAEPRLRPTTAPAAPVPPALLAASAPEAPATPAAPAPAPAAAASTPLRQIPRTLDGSTRLPKAAPPPSKTAVLRAQLTVQHSRLLGLMVALGIVAVGAFGVIVWQGRKSSEVTTRLAHRADSLAQELALLQRLKAQTDSERTRLEQQIRGERDPARVQLLRSRLDTVSRRSTAIEAAQGVDYNMIRSRNDPAVAMIYVRFADTTRMWTGTAFSVSPSGLLLTNRHIVIGEGGERPQDIAIQFSGSRDVLPARLARVAPDADVASVQLESAGPFPSVAGLAADETPPEGAPIALIGFPGGAGDGTPRATLVTGSMSRVLGDSLLELDAFSGTGASGSPIFDRSGRVIGVLFGGRGGSSSRAIVGLPIRRAMALLQAR